ncbi:unnamed protein product [Thelazia callipaeda]|uniref:PNPLA domain-containing protein n=1 Tax=Thelazia callipaeda TaxID=103827 RepID=A0A0N5CYI5_THECL|nr:unnamed protein product [Thelazia callipaeda]
MWRRARTSLRHLSKHYKNSDGETKTFSKDNERNNAISGKIDSSRKKDAGNSVPFASSLSASNHLSYLSSILSSLWPSEGTKESEKIKVKSGRIKATYLTKSALFDKTKLLVSDLLSTEADRSVMLRTQELCKHCMEYPDSRAVVFQFYKSVVRKLKHHLQNTNDNILKEQIRQFSSLMGDISTPQSAGIRVLSLDGGGTRGMLSLDVLQALENKLKGLKVVEAFDLIVGVSTGAIIGALLTAKRLSIEKCKEVYIDISRELFHQDKFSGMSGLLLSHAYYNTEKWKQILKNVIGEQTLLEICGSREKPRLSIISCTVNTPTLQSYIFRTYGLPYGSESHYHGGCNYKLWEALQASSAAPGYFQEVSLGPLLFQDGGVLCNNPTALAFHEARMLWPQERIQCVVSIGCGHAVSEAENVEKLSTRLREKIIRIIDSATDTELVDLCMRDTLPKGSYSRFNPHISYPYSLDETDPKRITQMGQDAQLYISRNQAKFEAVAKLLMATPTRRQRFLRNWRKTVSRTSIW